MNKKQRILIIFFFLIKCYSSQVKMMFIAIIQLFNVIRKGAFVNKSILMIALIIIAKEPMVVIWYRLVVRIQIALSFLNGKINQVI